MSRLIVDVRLHDATPAGFHTATANGFRHQGRGSSGSDIYKHASTGHYLQVHPDSGGGYRARVTGAGVLAGHSHPDPEQAVQGALVKTRTNYSA